jgi:hypothetical protein
MSGSPTSEASDDHATPRWVKVFGVIALIVLAAFVILHLAGGGPRGH